MPEKSLKQNSKIKGLIFFFEWTVKVNGESIKSLSAEPNRIY